MYPLAKVLIVPLRSMGVTPNMITIFNVLLGFFTSYLLVHEQLALCALGLVAHQLLDAMDGAMARRYGLTSEFGAKLDEYTDLVFGTCVGATALCYAWPNPLSVVFIVACCAVMLLGELAYKSAEEKRKPFFVEELTFLELVGLWGIENMTYNLVVIGIVVYASKKSSTSYGWMQAVIQFMSYHGISMPIMTTSLMVICAVLILAVKFKDYQASKAAQARNDLCCEGSAPLLATEAHYIISVV